MPIVTQRYIAVLGVGWHLAPTRYLAEHLTSIAVLSARQKTYFFRKPVLPRLVISGLIINTGAIFSCRRIKNDNN
ncbi:MAG: hypothetical protein KZQ59_12955, partial [Candidatus Thiodiazotropha sp. (ex Lucinoma aequizonata)]|nr:hypothetical protein [Candidatus Thiodiazotropha sp. (ex Lucinoma aequizonata)]MCU7897096.1 hypothetical protein [Candidatus Thiodiazotropha sp. (ex Lucinoma aequizonata)]MCU7898374.1 hypothetical protein [Candidatus Thiodiazotropha sp. (ex Lucinoma aequizonata)]MCU7909810.1 hypothetical protein [Candidatus Thiodiazotropha sp. (ex Lucinoma aequizonata)]